MDSDSSKRRKLEEFQVDMSNQEVDRSDSEDDFADSELSVTALPGGTNGNDGEQSRKSRQSSQDTLKIPGVNSHPADLLDLQIKELLAKLSPKNDNSMGHVEAAIHRLRDAIEGIPSRGGLPAADARKLFETSSDVEIPFSTFTPDEGSKLSLGYSKPTRIDVIRSYARSTAVLLDGRLTVDLAVTMPSYLFQANDYRDYRYFQKRAFYLACIADGLQRIKPSFPSLTFAYQDDNFLQPALLVESELGSGSGKNLKRSTCLFKATLQVLSTLDLIADPMILQANRYKHVKTDSPVLFDGARGLNILYKMSAWSYQRIRHEAHISLKMLTCSVADPFIGLFISRVDETCKMFDHVFRIPVESSSLAHSRTSLSRNDGIVLAYDLYDMLKYGLGNRAFMIYPQLQNTPQPWTITAKASHSYPSAHLTVGLLLNPEHCGRTVDRGPSIDDRRAADEFRTFWGAKAELRRFKDGSILESVIWNDSDSKRTVIDQIVTYILNRHFEQQGGASKLVGGVTFDKSLPPQVNLQQNTASIFSPATRAFELLTKSLWAMDGLPLQLRTIAPASPELRFPSLHPPSAGKLDVPRRPIDIQVQFEGSTRWPEDITAVQRTKIAFLLKIARCLESDSSIEGARVGLDKPKQKLLGQSFLDVAIKDGPVFRLRIYHDHELKMLEYGMNGPVQLPASREELAMAISEHKRKYIQCPKYTQAVITLRTRFPMLLPTTWLLKKWRDCHLLSPHIRDELLELLAIRTFVCPYPWVAPGSPNSAFLRTIAFIAAWDWQADPVVVDFNSELNINEVAAIHVRFKAWRKIDPGMNRVAMFAASNLDPEGITWTERFPSRMIASRLTNLARAANDLVGEQGLDLKSEMLFVPSMAEYDFVIHLKHEHGAARRKKTLFKNLQLESYDDSFEAIADPVQHFLNELEDLYGDNLILFYNQSETTLIAGLWNPQTGPRNWKIGLNYPTKPLAAAQITIDKAAVLHGIARLGGDLISHINQNP
ncbi:MAG: hypothetical protein Q9174_000495 [Haloplaca sp. 1 TL-2023]